MSALTSAPQHLPTSSKMRALSSQRQFLIRNLPRDRHPAALQREQQLRDRLDRAVHGQAVRRGRPQLATALQARFDRVSRAVVGLTVTTEAELGEGRTAILERYVFGDGDTPMDGDNFRKRIWEPLCVDAKVGKIRIHDLRHGYASQLIAAGKPRVVVDGRRHCVAIDRVSGLSDSWGPQSAPALGVRARPPPP